ncbi:MAG: EAL domain-containing protein [Cyanobacteria bacterium J06607_15]
MMISSNPNILIVEDELLIAKNTAKKLEKFGYTVIGIMATGQAAIDFVQNKKPDLILMDIAIKGNIDGIETASQIKGMFDIPIIFLTAYANEKTLDRASKTGCYGYLIKPYKEQELQATVKMTLSKHLEQSSIQNALQSTIHEYSSQYDDIYKDSVTGLPNKLFLRDLFDYLLSLIVQGDKKTKDSTAPLAINQKLEFIGTFNISLDRFEQTNKYLSRSQQHNLLQEIAQRLTDCIYDFNLHGSVVSIKPDNLAILLALKQKSAAKDYGQKLLSALTQSFVVGDREIFLSPNIGIAFYPSDSKNVEDLLQQGEKAIEYAKTQGGKRCQTFTPAFNIKSSRRSGNFELESELHYALERQELELFYQPKLDLQSSQIIGAEALVRWNHPKMGRIEAERFIPLAEDIGLGGSIGEWVMKTACRQLRVWHDAGFNTLKMGVNLSSTQFRQLDLFHKITQVLFNVSLEAQYLELELTETILVENIKANVQRLNLFKKLGIGIALDDFGTGYSSLSYLQQFPFDILKIDRCFIHDINRNKINAVITQGIIEMAHQLGLKVVAEGVETSAELDFLKNIKCDAIQGRLFSRPLSAREFNQLVRIT